MNGDTFTSSVGETATPTSSPTAFTVAETHTITGGTGRFAGARGSFVVARTVDFADPFTAGSMDGEVTKVLTLEHEQTPIVPECGPAPDGAFEPGALDLLRFWRRFDLSATQLRRHPFRDLARFFRLESSRVLPAARRE